MSPPADLGAFGAGRLTMFNLDADAPPADDRPRAGVLTKVVRRLEAALDKLAALDGSLDLTVRGKDYTATITRNAPTTPAVQPAAVQSDAFALASFFSDLERSIVLLMARRPLPQRAAANALRNEAGASRICITLASLKERGVLRSGPEGYEVIDPAFVELARSSDEKASQ